MLGPDIIGYVDCTLWSLEQQRGSAPHTPVVRATQKPTRTPSVCFPARLAKFVDPTLPGLVLRDIKWDRLAPRLNGRGCDTDVL